MMAERRELSVMTKIFYIDGLVSAIGLELMILSGKVSIGDALGLQYRLCP
jgi:hypothetical protein